MPTHVRIKLNFVISLPTDPLKTRIPRVPLIEELILDGVRKAIPTATELFPGATIEMETVDFVQTSKAHRRALRQRQAETVETVPGTPLAPGRSTVVVNQRRRLSQSGRSR